MGSICILWSCTSEALYDLLLNWRSLMKAALSREFGKHETVSIRHFQDVGPDQPKTHHGFPAGESARTKAFVSTPSGRQPTRED